MLESKLRILYSDVCNENKNIEILEWDILTLLGVDDIGKL